MDTKLVVYTTQRITDDDREHDGGDGHVEPILLHDEVKKRENHTGDWCEDEDNHSYLYATCGIAMEDALPQSTECGEV